MRIMRMLFVSGGSVGHLAPLVAVEHAVKEASPKTKTLFVCSTKTSDADFLHGSGVPFVQIPSPKRSVLFPLHYLRASRAAKKIVKDFRPDIVFSKGGSVSIAVCRAAKKAGIPVIIHESDGVMGKANKYIARFASTICLGFPPSDDQLTFPVKPVVTGNPIRACVTGGNVRRGRNLTLLAGKKPVLLVLGGSQGAAAINDAVVRNLDALLDVCDVVHLTGPGKAGAEKRAGYWKKEFAHEELRDLYAIADLALTRAGAGSISELAANGVPMLLCPIRGLANDHQFENAVRVERAGAGQIIAQDVLERDLVDTVQHILGEKNLLATMRAHVTELVPPDPARRIAKILLQSVARQRKSD